MFPNLQNLVGLRFDQQLTSLELRQQDHPAVPDLEEDSGVGRTLPGMDGAAAAHQAIDQLLATVALKRVQVKRF